MPSFTLARRLSAIVIVLMLIVWLIMVMSFYLGKDWEEQSFRPSPERLAAIIEAMEDARPDQRPGVLAALNTPILSIRIVAPPDKLNPATPPGMQATRSPGSIAVALATGPSPSRAMPHRGRKAIFLISLGTTSRRLNSELACAREER